MTIHLAIFGLITSFLVGLLYVATAPLIADAKEAARLEALYEVAKPLLDIAEIGQPVQKRLDSDRPHTLSATISVTPIINQGSQIGVVIPLATDEGYSGRISMLLALNMKQRIVGYRVIDHKETPGLGDRIDTHRSDWILGFNHLAYRDLPEEAWSVTKDGGKFDIFTGATITPRAVVKGLAVTLAYFETHPEILEIDQ